MVCLFEPNENTNRYGQGVDIEYKHLIHTDSYFQWICRDKPDYPSPCDLGRIHTDSVPGELWIRSHDLLGNILIRVARWIATSKSPSPKAKGSNDF